MNPIFVDIHIHTSNDPNSLNQDYQLDVLLEKIREVTHDEKHLISFTDHNTINKKVYLDAVEKADYILLGVELHIKNYEDADLYHCHIIFDIDKERMTVEIIDELNLILDKLYPNKVITPETEYIPTIEEITKEFDKYEFVLLPHGGQSHSTFDKSIPKNVVFDTTMERSIYYNQFDGFTARSNKGLNQTVKYFKKLGINDFVNLITCTDNYDPNVYPRAKAKEAEEFLPTWMNALPTFEGLRLSLSESSRLVYNKEKPKTWSTFIESVKLKNDAIDIDVELTPGLNVVIGGSSSGKTLFVDSLFNKLSKDFEKSVYTKYNVEDIVVTHPTQTIPHYISQNYIMQIVNPQSEGGIASIDIVKKVFPGNKQSQETVNSNLQDLNRALDKLVEALADLEQIELDFGKIPIITELITEGTLKGNLMKNLLPSEDEINKINLPSVTFNELNTSLESVNKILSNNELIEYDSSHAVYLKNKLEEAHNISQKEERIRVLIKNKIREYDDLLKVEDREQQVKRLSFEKLLDCIKSYSKSFVLFNDTLDNLSKFSIKITSEEVESMGHKLSIENGFTIDKDTLIGVINRFLKNKIPSLENIPPNLLFDKQNFSKKNPKVADYADFKKRIYSDFVGMNKQHYKITTNDGRDFDTLSAGWKTSVVLDLILGYKEDSAPLIIDQPEDNLATTYINTGLIEAIKKIKPEKQIILVSHNATIPMLGDAQNIILCEYKEGEGIVIRSSPLEGVINSTKTMDHIARITDGGKGSIKKRVKKYNLKKFREE